MNSETPYAQFNIVDEALIDGWRLAMIMGYVDQTWGDAFVQAPDGTRAGVVWVLESDDFKTLQLPDGERWGVYQVPFKKRMANRHDVADNFRDVLPKLRDAYLARR